MSRSSKAASYSSRRRSRCGSCGGCLGRLLVTVLVLAVVAGLVVFLPGLLDTRHRIVLDPGHGGGDPGAPGIVTESEMTDRRASSLIASCSVVIPAFSMALGSRCFLAIWNFSRAE